MTKQGSALPHVQKSRVRVPWITRVLWRYFVTGRELRGPGDNATFLDDATEDYRHNPREKLTRARWRRVARRWALLGVPLLFLLIAGVSRIARWTGASGWAALPWGEALAGYVAILAAGALAYAWSEFTRWYPARLAVVNLIRPAYEVLCRELHAPHRRRDAVRHITLSGNAARVYLPRQAALDDKARAALVDKLGRRLGMPDAAGAWTEATSRAFVDLAPAPLPPSGVTLASIADALLEATFARPVAGLTYGRRPVYLDFDNDSPHVLVSGGSGAGKSTFYRCILPQRMRFGSGTIVLDFKHLSHIRWMRGMSQEQALYFHEIPHIHDALVCIMDETVRRKRITDDAILDALRPVDIVVEELNTVTPMLADYWTEQVSARKAAARTAIRQAKRDKDDDALEEAERQLGEAMGLPKQSPALQAIKYGVNLGREVKIFWHVLGQSVSAQAVRGRDTRASFNIRALGRWNLKDWNMLAGGVPFVAPPANAEVGIWAIVAGGRAEIIRVPWLTNDEAYQLANPLANQGQAVASDVADTGSHVTNGLVDHGHGGQHVASELANTGSDVATVANVGQRWPGSGHILANMPAALLTVGQLPARLANVGQAAGQAGQPARSASGQPGQPRAIASGPATLAEILTVLPAKPSGDRLTLEALRYHRKMDPSFPPVAGREGTADLFELVAVEEWFAHAAPRMRGNGQ